MVVTKRGIVFTLLILIIASLLIFAIFDDGPTTITGQTITDVNPEVEQKLKEDDTVRVIVKLKDQEKDPEGEKLGITALEAKEEVLDKLKTKELKNKKEFTLVNGFSGEVTKKGLKKLKNDPNVESISLDYPISLALSDSRGIVNATKVQLLLGNLDNNNITGKGFSACVLDTGVYGDHANLGDRLLREVCYCSVSEGSNSSCCPDGSSAQITGGISDNHGHGTHVAGIVASNDTTYRGMAPEAGIVSVKVLNSTGSGTTSDLISAIEFCINNRTLYNISAITMSLGCSGSFTSSCDGSSTCDSNSIATLVNDAVDKNVTVTAATGNQGSTTEILSPACIENVTAVSSTTKADAVSGFSNRNSVTDIFAPGSSITSTYNTGGFASSSGTSQATPHVAGAILLMQDYKAKENGTRMSPFTLQDILNDTGRRFTDGGTGLTFSIIELYAAVKALDVQAPHVEIFSPSNTTYSTNNSININYTSRDSFLESVFYSLDGATNVTLSANTTINVSEGGHTLTLYANDSQGNLNSTQIIFSIDLTPSVSFESPENVSYNTQSILIDISNSSTVQNVWFDNETTNETYTTSVTRTYSEGSHTLTAYVNDSEGREAETSVTFSVDLKAPLVEIESPQNLTYNNGTIVVNITNNSDAANVWFFNGSNNVTYTGTVNVDFSDGEITLIAYANDSAGNLNSTSATFIVDETAPVVSFVTPNAGDEVRSDFLINISIEDPTSGVNASDVYYRWENTTDNSAWIQMSNVTKSYWNATFNISSVAEGTYNIKINASDNAGNKKIATATSIEKDITPPVQTSIGSSPGSTTATITWTTDVSADSDIDYGTDNETLSSQKTDTDLETSHSLELTGLSASTVYYYNVTSCDGAGNCVTNGTYTFTTSAASSSSSSSSSGGGGGGGAASSVISSTTEELEETAGSGSAGEEGSSEESTASKRADIAIELEDKLEELFESKTFIDSLEDVTKDITFTKKLLVKKDESIVRIKVSYDGEKESIDSLFVFLPVPKAFAEHAADIKIKTDDEKFITVVEEDPSFLIVYETTKKGQERIIEIITKDPVDPEVISLFDVPDSYSTELKIPSTALLKTTGLSITNTFGKILSYWWIPVLVFIVGVGVFFFFRSNVMDKIEKLRFPKGRPAPHFKGVFQRKKKE